MKPNPLEEPIIKNQEPKVVFANWFLEFGSWFLLSTPRHAIGGSQKSADVKRFRDWPPPSANHEKWRSGSNSSRKSVNSARPWRPLAERGASGGRSLSGGRSRGANATRLGGSFTLPSGSTLPLCQLGDRVGKVLAEFKIMPDIALRFASEYFATPTRSWK